MRLGQLLSLTRSSGLKIKFLREWLGNRRGAVLDVLDRAAQELIDRKIAKPYKEPEKRNVRKTH